MLKSVELKSESRLFAMMLLGMHLYFSATESNIVNKLMVYFPQQTMALSELHLTHRLLILTQETDSTHPDLPIFLHIDFEKWNIQWRKETTEPFFGIIDQLFGSNELSPQR